MRKLIVFNQVSVDGYFVDAAGDMSWAHKNDPEWNAFASENAGGGGELVFGRVTYEMMASFWPTPQAMQMMPAVAKGMNQSPKIVFSRTLDRASWNNTRLIKGDIVAQMRELKRENGPGMVILGSGSIVSQLAQTGLIDEYQIVTNPIVLGSGKTMFEAVRQKLQLKLANSRTFKNGNVLLHYESAA
jgi:dihydrofolate reductase